MRRGSVQRCYTCGGDPLNFSARKVSWYFAACVADPQDYWPSVIDPRFPWIRGHHTNTAQLPARVADLRTGETAIVRTRDELVRFVATHSAARGHLGLGDAVKSLTKRLGFGE